jgi:hypothetical protein
MLTMTLMLLPAHIPLSRTPFAGLRTTAVFIGSDLKNTQIPAQGFEAFV